MQSGHSVLMSSCCWVSTLKIDCFLWTTQCLNLPFLQHSEIVAGKKDVVGLPGWHCSLQSPVLCNWNIVVGFIPSGVSLELSLLNLTSHFTRCTLGKKETKIILKKWKKWRSCNRKWACLVCGRREPSKNKLSLNSNYCDWFYVVIMYTVVLLCGCFFGFGFFFSLPEACMLYSNLECRLSFHLFCLW